MTAVAAGTVIPALHRRADEVDLFLVSAAMWVPHRIHYDRDYVRSEGHADLLVHGPLQGAWMAQMLTRWARPRGGRLEAISWRNRRPLFCGVAVVCRGTVTGVSDGVATCEVWVEREQDGERTTVGSAEVRLG